MRLNQKILKEMINEEIEGLIEEGRVTDFLKQAGTATRATLGKAAGAVSAAKRRAATSRLAGSREPAVQKLLNDIQEIINQPGDQADSGALRRLAQAVALFKKRSSVSDDESLTSKEPAAPDTPLEERRRKRKITRRSK
tara:strand:- start:3711 stop:4127 length:417 start_codon:yes stop_codon:yes gene_type:complete